MPIDNRSSNFVAGSTAFERVERFPPTIVAPKSDNPRDKISIANENAQFKKMKYPFDLGKYQFVLMEGSFYTIGGATIGTTITWDKMYQLPLPVGLTENHVVQYDTDFNMLEEAAKALPNAPKTSSTLEQVGSTLLNIAPSLLGISINQYKSITLKNPNYNMHHFSWKFSPKTFEESQEINNIIQSLRSAAVPSSTGFRAAFTFPKAFGMFFFPNHQFMYRFKPCVLKEFSIDFQGGNPAPAFYASDKAGISSSLPLQPGRQIVNFNNKSSPPESIILKTAWLELEYWRSEDFNNEPSDPFGAWSWYSNQ